MPLDKNQSPDALQVQKALTPVMQLLQQGALARGNPDTLVGMY